MPGVKIRRKIEVTIMKENLNVLFQINSTYGSEW